MRAAHLTIASLLAGLLLVTAAIGQTLHVRGVAGNDVLKVRIYPDMQSGVVGVIPPYARGIIDLGQSADGWLFVRYDNIEGWAAARFLAPDLPRGRVLPPN